MKRILAILVTLILFCGMAVVSCSSGTTQDNAKDKVKDIAWPEKNIKILVPYAAGGSCDMTARVVAEELTKIFGVNVLVENRVGGGGAILASEIVHNTVADGYTYMLTTASQSTMLPHFSEVNFKYDDFKYVSQLGGNSHVLCVRKDFPANTFSEFMEYAKKNQVRLSTPGTNNTPSVILDILKDKIGMEVTLMPQTGAPAALAQLMGGHIEAVICQASDQKSFATGGEIKQLITFAQERDPLASNIASAKELGHDYFKGLGPSCYSIAAPKNTPEEIIAKMDAAIGKALSSQTVFDNLTKLNFSPKYLNSKDVTKAVYDLEEYIGPFIDSKYKKK